MITAAGIGSGLDVESIVSQLMAIERKPLDALQQKKTDIDARISAYGNLKSALSTFQAAMKDLSTPTALKVYTATSEDDGVFTATATSTAAASTYQIEVIRQAERHKFASVEALDTDTFGGGAGDSLTIQVGASATDSVTVDLSTASTLGDIRDAINDDPANPGVTATVISGNNGNQKLVLTADDSGAAHALTLSYGGGISAATFGFQEINNIGGNTALLDAEVNVDGYTVTRGNNTIDDIIQGVTLDLHSAVPGTAFTLDIARDINAVSDSVQAFADSYNEILSTIQTLRDGDLATDSALFSVERGLRSVMNTPASGLPSGLSYLGEIGLTFSREGTLTVDTNDVEHALTSDFNSVSELFSTAGQGFASRLDTLVKGWLDVDGLIKGRTDGLDSSKRLLDTREESLQYRLTQVESSLRAQFSQLDTLLGGLQVTSDYLSQQLQMLPSINNSGNG